MALGKTRPIIQKVVSLTLANSFVELIAPGIAVRQVFVSQLPAGAIFSLRLGLNNPPVPMFQGASAVYLAEPLTDGIYYDNTAQPGLTATVTVTQGAF